MAISGTTTGLDRHSRRQLDGDKTRNFVDGRSMIGTRGSVSFATPVMVAVMSSVGFCKSEHRTRRLCASYISGDSGLDLRTGIATWQTADHRRPSTIMGANGAPVVTPPKRNRHCRTWQTITCRQRQCMHACTITLTLRLPH